MAVLPILTWPDACLSARCDPVGPGMDVGALVRDMFDTMYDAPGRGLAAPQVGVMSRIFVIDCTWKEGQRSPMVFVNPEITASADVLVSAEEGCLSIPGVAVTIIRPAWVEMVWRDAHGAACSGRFDGFAAACVQHERDHLDGIVTFDRLPANERAAAEAGYLEAAP